MRAVKEQTSVGSSLFAQPLMLQAIPLESEGALQSVATDSPEMRAAGPRCSAALENAAGGEGK